MIIKISKHSRMNTSMSSVSSNGSGSPASTPSSCYEKPVFAIKSSKNMNIGMNNYNDMTIPNTTPKTAYDNNYNDADSNNDQKERECPSITTAMSSLSSSSYPPLTDTSTDTNTLGTMNDSNATTTTTTTNNRKKKNSNKILIKQTYNDQSQVVFDGVTGGERSQIRLYNDNNVDGPFPIKLQTVLKVVEQLGMQHIISWLPHGRAFMVHRPREFEEEIMGRFFKQTKLSSFKRQLNLYDFQRVTHGTDAGSYYHENFLRGKPLLATKMLRRKIKGKIRVSTSPDDEPDFYLLPMMGPIQGGGSIGSCIGAENLMGGRREQQQHRQQQQRDSMSMSRGEMDMIDHGARSHQGATTMNSAVNVVGTSRGQQGGDWGSGNMGRSTMPDLQMRMPISSSFNHQGDAMLHQLNRLPFSERSSLQQQQQQQYSLQEHLLQRRPMPAFKHPLKQSEFSLPTSNSHSLVHNANLVNSVTMDNLNNSYGRAFPSFEMNSNFVGAQSISPLTSALPPMSRNEIFLAQEIQQRRNVIHKSQFLN